MFVSIRHSKSIVVRRSLDFVLFLILLATTAEGAHSRRRPVVLRQGNQIVKYDRAITTFSPDGRLQQVEYGMEASNRGESIVTALVNETIAIIAVRGTDKMHRIDSHILLVTAGLAGDARALASALRSSCQRHYLSFGEAPTVYEVAELAAQLQHGLTKTAGARPLGCTAVVIGVTKAENTAGEVQIYRTDPGGVLEQCSYCVAGKRNQHILTSLTECFEENKDVEGKLFNSLAFKMVELLTEVDDDNASNKVDLWIIRSEPKKQGCFGARCAKDISLQSLDWRLPYL